VAGTDAPSYNLIGCILPSLASLSTTYIEIEMIPFLGKKKALSSRALSISIKLHYSGMRNEEK
jgi:hypothetical protein